MFGVNTTPGDALQRVKRQNKNMVRHARTTNGEKKMVTKSELLAAVAYLKPARSAWGRGVQEYAVDLVEYIDCDLSVPDVLPATWTDVRALLLNGADDWKRYSYGGCALVYDGDIAERLCTQSELRRNRGGRCNPNRFESWLDVQTRALVQASRIVRREFERLAARSDGACKANG